MSWPSCPAKINTVSTVNTVVFINFILRCKSFWFLFWNFFLWGIIRYCCIDFLFSDILLATVLTNLVALIYSSYSVLPIMFLVTVLFLCTFFLVLLFPSFFSRFFFFSLILLSFFPLSHTLFLPSISFSFDNLSFVCTFHSVLSSFLVFSLFLPYFHFVHSFVPNLIDQCTSFLLKVLSFYSTKFFMHSIIFFVYSCIFLYCIINI